MKKLFYPVFFSLLLFSSLLRAQGNLIGVVYDNSTSMTQGGRAEPTSYSFRIMCTLMVPGDTLAIYTLGEAGRGRGEPRTFPQERMDELLSWIERIPYNSGTPFEPVNMMLRYQSQQGNPHRSIVVFTDGGFAEGYDRSYIDASPSESGIKAGYLILSPDRDVRNHIERQQLLQKMLSKFNGSESRGNFMVEDADYTDLPARMGALFSFINDLNIEGQQEYIRIEANTLRIITPFPLKTIRLIYQQKNIKAPDLTAVNTDHVPHLRHLSLTGQRSEAYHALSGYIDLKSMPADSGGIRLTFDQAISRNQLFIILDTNLELHAMPVDRSGSTLVARNGEYSIGNSDSLKLKVYFESEGVKFHFSPRLLKDLKLWAEVRNGQELKLNTQDGIDFYTDSFTFGGGKSLSRVVDVFARYPGHFAFQKSLSFSLNPIKTWLWLNGSKEMKNIWDSVTHCDLSEIDPLFLAILTADGDSVTDQYDVQLQVSPAIRLLNLVEKKQLHYHFANYFLPWKNPDRDVTIKITCTPRTSLYTPLTFSSRIEIERGPWWCRWLPFIIFVTLFLLLAIKISCCLKTSRFRRRARVFVYNNNPGSPYKPIPRQTFHLYKFSTSLWSHLICRSQKYSFVFGGKRLTLRAGSGKSAYVTKKTAKGITTILVDGEELDTLSGQGRFDVRITDDSTIQTADRKSRAEYSPTGIRK